jgi:hypothetical protein
LADVAAWPLAAWAQQPGRMRRVGVLMAFDENDPEAKAYLSEFTQGLAELGWTDGRNLRMDVRWAAGNVDRMRMFAKELLDLQPDVILAHGTPATAAFQRETRGKTSFTPSSVRPHSDSRRNAALSPEHLRYHLIVHRTHFIVHRTKCSEMAPYGEHKI